MSGLVCDVCGKKDIPTNVRSSSLGAASFSYCQICDAMGAEPVFVLESIVGIDGCDLDKVSNRVCLTYYDRLKDTYIDMREGLQNIELTDGRKFETRSELVKLT